MDLQLWSKVEEKRGIVLALRGDEVHRLEISGNKARQDVPRIIEALQQGQEPGAVGANSVQSLKLASIGQARVSPDQDDVEFHAEGENGSPLKFTTVGKQASEIARTILARTGRPFREDREDITAVEAVMPPLIIGVILGVVWALLYGAAGQVASGEEIEVHGRRAGLKRLFIMVAEMLGVNGTLVLGAVLLLWILGWATMRVVRRPQRTVWQAQSVG
jgi:hypothetical protein